MSGGLLAISMSISRVMLDAVLLDRRVICSLRHVTCMPIHFAVHYLVFVGGSLCKGIIILFVMPRLDCQTRRKIILLRAQGYSVHEIKNRLEEESTFVSRQAMYKLFRKFQTYQTYVDLPRGAPAKKITTEMAHIMEEELSKNDELTATQLLSILRERHPTLNVSLTTIKRERQRLGWVCTRPHYCQLIREVSTS